MRMWPHPGARQLDSLYSLAGPQALPVIAARLTIRSTSLLSIVSRLRTTAVDGVTDARRRLTALKLTT